MDRRSQKNMSIVLSSRLSTSTEIPEFDSIIALGKGILPFVVERLLKEENFRDILIYDRLQPLDSLKIKYGCAEGTIQSGGEQNRARRTVLKWLESWKMQGKIR